MRLQTFRGIERKRLRRPTARDNQKNTRQTNSRQARSHPEDHEPYPIENTCP
jgi:hypothetical protein